MQPSFFFTILKERGCGRCGSCGCWGGSVGGVEVAKVKDDARAWKGLRKWEVGGLVP